MGLPLDWLIQLVVIFIISFASNVTPFVGASYTLLGALNLSLFGFTPFGYLAVVLVTASGATLAKVGIYYGSFGLRRFLLPNKNVRLIGRIAGQRSFYAGLFVAAVMPVFPFDDYLFIGAGANSATLAPMTSVTFLAKLVKSSVEIPLEYSLLSTLTNTFGITSTVTTIITVIAFIGIGVVVYKVDWEATFARFRRKPSAPGGSRGDA
ncbi:MAG: hypothetical protein OK438_03830 [Thaumarchaeota archaeon]|nr:hypothetical protein [Nitrososphaerota archaeon]